MSDEAKKEETKEQPQDQSDLSDEQLEARLHLLRGSTDIALDFLLLRDITSANEIGGG